MRMPTFVRPPVYATTEVLTKRVENVRATDSALFSDRLAATRSSTRVAWRTSSFCEKRRDFLPEQRRRPQRRYYARYNRIDRDHDFLLVYEQKDEKVISRQFNLRTCFKVTRGDNSLVYD